MSDASLEREAVSAGREVREFLRLTRQDERAAHLHQKLGFSRHAPVSVVVVGEPGTGRTSLINTLIGRSALPVGIDDTSDTCWTVRHGEQEPATAAENIDDGVRTLSVSVDSPILARGLTVTRPPCLGGPAEAAAVRVTRGYADVLLLAVDPTSSRPSRAVTGFVEAVSPFVGTVIVVPTKIDLEPGWRTSMATYEQDLRISAAPSTRIRVIGVSSERRAEADRLRSRGHDAEADYQDEESGFLTLGAEIERMVTDRRRLRSRDIMHACHVHLREAHTTAVGTDPAVNVEEELVRLRRQLDRLSGFADERSALLAGFDEVLAALSGEIRATVMRTVPELEGLARAVDLTAVSAQHDLGHRLNIVLADVERTLDDLCRSYQQRASRQVMESLREHGFEMMLAAHEPAITRPDTADSRIDPVFAPREVSLADACLGAVHIVQRVVGARPELPDEGSRRVLAVVRQPVTGAVLQVAARSGPLAPAVLATGAAVLLAAGAREAALERARQALRFQVEEASHRLACFPSRYQEQIEQYATQVWKALGATAARLADHLAEEMARAERTLDAERRRAKSDDLAAEATRMLGARLRDDVRHLLARFDAAA